MQPGGGTGWSTPRAGSRSSTRHGAEHAGGRGRLARRGRPGDAISTGCTSGLDAVGHAAAADQGGSGRRDDRRRHRRARSPRSRWPASTRSRRPARATTSPTHASRPFDRDRGRLRARRGRGRARPGGARARPPARRARLREIARVRVALQRLPHDRAAARTAGRWREAIRDGAWPSARVDPGRDRLRQRARLGHQAERPARDRGVQAQPRASTPTHVPVSSIKSMVGHSLGAIGSHGDGRLRAGHRATASSRPPPTCESPIPSATSTTCR